MRQLAAVQIRWRACGRRRTGLGHFAVGIRSALFCLFAILSLAAMNVFAEVAAVPAGTNPAIVTRFRGGKLWLRAQHAPPKEVLEAIARKARIRFVAGGEIGGEPLTLDIRGMPLERAIRNVVSAIRQVAGHTMSYGRDGSGATRLVEVGLFVAGKAPASASTGVVYGNVETAHASVLPPLDVDSHVGRMVAAGVPREQAEKVLELTKEVRGLQATPVPGTYRPEDLSAEGRTELQALVERGVPMERAVQMLLVQEKYQKMLTEITPITGAASPTPLPAR